MSKKSLPTAGVTGTIILLLKINECAGGQSALIQYAAYAVLPMQLTSFRTVLGF